MTSNGVLRSPTKKWIEDLLRVHGNACLDSSIEAAAQASQAVDKAEADEDKIFADYGREC